MFLEGNGGLEKGEEIGQGKGEGAMVFSYLTPLELGVELLESAP